MHPHQYVQRGSNQVMTENLFGDRILAFLYSGAREHAGVMLRWATGARASQLLALLQFDWPLAPKLAGNQRFLQRCGVDLSECLDAPQELNTPRRIFERRIRYWHCRPMPDNPQLVVSPCDARLLLLSLRRSSPIFVKDKFFTLDELLGEARWANKFRAGDCAVLRLTPEKYHHNHTPVAGKVLDAYEVPGAYHSCNPRSVLELGTPLSKNRRFVTIIDSDVPGGTGVGTVAMVEVVALMIGQVEQQYCATRYQQPEAVEAGMFLRRGQPKSLFRPGSSSVVLLFQHGRIRFDQDLLRNLAHPLARSRFSILGQPLVETEVMVRSPIGRALSSEEAEP